MACMKMMEVNMKMVQDPDLRTFMQNSLQNKKMRMKEMQQFIMKTAPAIQTH